MAVSDLCASTMMIMEDSTDKHYKCDEIRKQLDKAFANFKIRAHEV